MAFVTGDGTAWGPDPFDHSSAVSNEIACASEGTSAPIAGNVAAIASAPAPAANQRPIAPQKESWVRMRAAFQAVANVALAPPGAVESIVPPMRLSIGPTWGAHPIAPARPVGLRHPAYLVVVWSHRNAGADGAGARR